MVRVKLTGIIILFFLHQEISNSQPLTLYDAIENALTHNQTVMYAAEKNYLSAQSQLNLAESAYRSKMNFDLNSA